MLQEKTITLPARATTPETDLYVKIYSLSKELGNRDVMILLPGGPGNDHSLYDTSFHSIAKTLSEFVDIVLFDPRGCGNSQKSELSYCSLDHYIDDVEALRIQLRIHPNTLIVFGQSYGSIVALGYCIRYPDSMKKLLLIGGAASSEFEKDARKNIARKGSSQQQKMAKKLWTGTFRDSLDLAEFNRVMGPFYSSTFDPNQSGPSIVSNIDILNFGWGKFLKNFDFRSDLGKITCDTLVLWGEDEIFFDRKEIDFITKHIKRCKLVTFAGCGHLLWVDDWEGFIKYAISFCQP